MKLPVLSHTFLKEDDNCPRKAWHKYVAKDLPFEKPSPEMQMGIDVHAAVERELKREQEGDYWQWIEPILRAPGIKHVEWSIAIAETGTAVDYWSPVAWLRGNIDVAIVAPPVAMIVDWKTGKVREDPTELQTFALLLNAQYPSVESITGAYVWLKDGTMGPLHQLGSTEGELNRIRNHWAMIKTRPVAQEWETTPNPLCGWCPVRSCPHWRQHK